MSQLAAAESRSTAPASSWRSSTVASNPARATFSRAPASRPSSMSTLTISPPPIASAAASQIVEYPFDVPSSSIRRAPVASTNR
jgi:hypothetical protein